MLCYTILYYFIDSPLYALRAMLVLAPVHTSMHALASAIEQFESQAETILLDDLVPRAPMMHHSCQSPEEVSLALQSLPLLHLVGFSAPLSLVTPYHIQHDSSLVGRHGVSTSSSSSSSYLTINLGGSLGKETKQ